MGLQIVGEYGGSDMLLQIDEPCRAILDRDCASFVPDITGSTPAHLNHTTSQCWPIKRCPGDDEKLEVPQQAKASGRGQDRKSTRLNSHGYISYAVFCLKKKKIIQMQINM